MGLLFALVMLTSGTMGDVPRCLYEATPKVVGNENFQALVREEFAKLPLRWRCYVMQHAFEIIESPPHYLHPDPKEGICCWAQGLFQIFVVEDIYRDIRDFDPEWALGVWPHEAAHLQDFRARSKARAAGESVPRDADHCPVYPIHVQALRELGAVHSTIEYVERLWDRDCDATARSRGGGAPQKLDSLDLPVL